MTYSIRPIAGGTGGPDGLSVSADGNLLGGIPQQVDEFARVYIVTVTDEDGDTDEFYVTIQVQPAYVAPPVIIPPITDPPIIEQPMTETYPGPYLEHDFDDVFDAGSVPSGWAALYSNGVLYGVGDDVGTGGFDVVTYSDALDADSSSTTQVISVSADFGAGLTTVTAAVVIGDTLYMCGYPATSNVRYPARLVRITNFPNNPTYDAFAIYDALGGLAYDGDRLLGLDGNGLLYEIDQNNLGRTLLGDTGIRASSITFDGTQLLLADFDNGNIYSINDLANMQPLLIGRLEDDILSMSYDLPNDRIYYTVFTRSNFFANPVKITNVTTSEQRFRRSLTIPNRPPVKRSTQRGVNAPRSTNALRDDSRQRSEPPDEPLRTARQVSTENIPSGVSITVNESSTLTRLVLDIRNLLPRAVTVTLTRVRGSARIIQQGIVLSAFNEDSIAIYNERPFTYPSRVLSLSTGGDNPDEAEGTSEFVINQRLDGLVNYSSSPLHERHLRVAATAWNEATLSKALEARPGRRVRIQIPVLNEQANYFCDRRELRFRPGKFIGIFYFSPAAMTAQTHRAANTGPQQQAIISSRDGLGQS